MVKKVFLLATDDLSWLSRDDRVLVKPAVNSPDRYPATTHPKTLEVVVDTLEARGAKVVIGDMSGVENVLQSPRGVLRGSSRDCFTRAGMSERLTERFVGFEERGWQGYDEFGSANLRSWKEGFWVTEEVRKADHIINLPRISTHGASGVTLGFKNWVGILREDSRATFHKNGPFWFFFDRFARPARLAFEDDRQDKFFEKIVEISLAVLPKLRCTLFTATEAQTTMGPDRALLKFGNLRLLRSFRAVPDTGLVFASPDPVAAELFAIRFLTYLYRNTPLRYRLLQKLLMLLNSHAVDLLRQRPEDNPFVKHAEAIGLGTTRPEINYLEVGPALKDDIWDKR